MICCKDCARYFEVVHKGQSFDLCDMDCYVDTIYEPWQEVECDFYVPLDVDDSESKRDQA